MKTIAEVGDTITLKAFCYTNKVGGTNESDSSFNEKYPSQIKARIVKEWNDYECGQRGWAVPDWNDKKLIAYLTRNAKKGDHNTTGEFMLYWSEFDIININS
jgi:hypothetical protein